MKIRVLVLFMLILSLTGCATSESEVMDMSHPYSDIQGSFMTQEPRSVRSEDDKPNLFFYKECSPTGDSSYYSKSSYFCEDRRF